MPTRMNCSTYLPVINSLDYYTKPSLYELAALEDADSGYCSRVPDFVVGRKGHGQVQFFGHTDVRWMNLDQIVKFKKNSVEVYDEEINKPPVGHGLNKPAEVTLVVQASCSLESGYCINKLREVSDQQGARFLSFDPLSSEWKFLVPHFSRFGLDDEEEDDVVMDDANAEPTSASKETTVHSSAVIAAHSLRPNLRNSSLTAQDARDLNTGPTVGIGEPEIQPTGAVLSHSLPSHLGLDPLKMQEMRSVMFPVEEEDEEYDGSFREKSYNRNDFMREDTPGSGGKTFSRRTPLKGSSRRGGSKVNPPSTNKEPQALIEYNVGASNLSPSMDIFMTGQKKGFPSPRLTKVEGFKLDDNIESPLPAGYSKNIVDAALFMGRSFRVGWGPNGVLVHSGTSVGDPSKGLSSMIQIEKVSADRAIRDERNKVNEELDDLCFSSLLNLHKSLDHEIDSASSELKLKKIVCSRLNLTEICRAYTSIIEKQIEVPGITASSHVVIMHQVAVWELIKVLFSERNAGEESKPFIDDEDGAEMMLDVKDRSLDIDIEAKPLVQRAEFSYWLQDCVCHRVQDEVGCLDDKSYLEQIQILLTGRQLDAAVELAASKGDVRLAILLSEAGGSVVNRHDMAQQLDFWRMNGLDFKYIENDRLKLYELLAGNIQGALQGSSVDWKRYLGLVMWYQLPPDTSLPVVVRTYHQLLTEGRAPPPVPVYIDEGSEEEPMSWRVGDRYDMAYYLMLLNADEEKNTDLIRTMFSAFSSTHDPLDYHMIWHQRAVLEAIGAFDLDDLHVLDMSFVFQLLCLGQCHWAIYVILHMPYHDDLPYFHVNLIKEILCRCCETWSKKEIQKDFIEELGIPTEWMHEAMALYFEYHRDFRQALEHFLECYDWQKAHLIFMTSVAHQLFLSSEHDEIWRITSSMEEHKLEIADWELGAGIYFDFYLLKNSLQEDVSNTELDPLGRKNEACRSFFDRLNESLVVWGSKLPIDARATFSKMSEELCRLLVSTPGENSTPAVQMNCFETMMNAPIPEDLRSSHLQNALTVFTYLLSEASA